MKKLLFTGLLLVSAGVAFAVSDWRHGVREPLWPEGRIPNFHTRHVGAMTYDENDADFLA